MRNRKNKRIFLKGFLALLLIWFISNALIIRFYAKNFSDTTSDVAIVLGAGSANGKLSKVFEERVRHAITLLKEQKVKKIIFTGGFGEGQQISDSQAAANYAIKKGVRKNQILIEEASTITFYNVVNAHELMEQHNLHSALIISDPYHMKRAMEMCQKVGIQAQSSPTPTSMYRSRKTKFEFLVKETFNYCIYQLYGQFRVV